MLLFHFLLNWISLHLSLSLCVCVFVSVRLHFCARSFIFRKCLFAILFTKEIVIYGMKIINYKVYMPEWLPNGAYAWSRLSLCHLAKIVCIIHKIQLLVNLSRMGPQKPLTSSVRRYCGTHCNNVILINQITRQQKAEQSKEKQRTDLLYILRCSIIIQWKYKPHILTTNSLYHHFWMLRYFFHTSCHFCAVCLFVFHPTTNSFIFCVLLAPSEMYERKQISSTHCAWYDWWRYVCICSMRASVLLLLLLLLPLFIFLLSSCSFNFIFITIFFVVVDVVAVIIAATVVVVIVVSDVVVSCYIHRRTLCVYWECMQHSYAHTDIVAWTVISLIWLPARALTHSFTHSHAFVLIRWIIYKITVEREEEKNDFIHE